MSFKVLVFYAGCTAAWFLLMPVFIIGGGIALLGYAVVTELTELVIGSRRALPIRQPHGSSRAK